MTPQQFKILLDEFLKLDTPHTAANFALYAKC